jgi:hypothetical protein
MKQNPSWEANNQSVQKFPRFLWNPKVHYRVHKTHPPPPLVPIMRQMHSVYTFLPSFRKILSNIIFLHKLRYCTWSLPFRFSNQNIVHISHMSHSCRTSRPPHPPWFDHFHNICWSVQVTKLLIMQSSSASRHFLPLRSNYSRQHPVLKSHDSLVGIALGYVLDDWGSRVWCPAGAGNFSLHHRVQNGSYTIGTSALPLGVKRPGREADHSPLSSAEIK